MIPLRRIAAAIAAFALAVTTLSAGLLPCEMTSGRERDAAHATPAHADHTPAREHHHGGTPGAQNSDSHDESGVPASCPVMGPCAFHLMAVPAPGRTAAAVASGRVAETPLLAPPTQTPAPELPPPRA